MSIINLVWKTILLFVCSLIQIVGVLIEGIAKILFETVNILVKAYNRVLECGVPKKKVKKVNIDIPL